MLKRRSTGLARLRNFFEGFKIFFAILFGVSSDDASPDNDYFPGYVGDSSSHHNNQKETAIDDDDSEQRLYDPDDHIFHHQSSTSGDNDSD